MTAPCSGVPATEMPRPRRNSEQSFVAEEAQGAQHGVGVDAEHGGEVFGGGEAFAGLGFALGDGAADLGGDLLVEVGGVGLVDLDTNHSASDTSTIEREVSVTVAAPPRPPEPTDTRPDDVVEALIEEARAACWAAQESTGDRRCRDTAAAPRRRWLIYGSTPRSVNAKSSIPPLRATTDAAAGELVASMHVFHGVIGGGPPTCGSTCRGWATDLDGDPDRLDGNGWRQQRLTPDGVEFVRDEIIASGLFDPDQPPPVNGVERPSDIEVRNGDRLVVVDWVPDQEWSPDFLRLVERLRNLQSWLPANAWADAEATTYVPDRYESAPTPHVCGHRVRAPGRGRRTPLQPRC